MRVTPETAKRFADHCKASNKSQSCVFAELVDLLDDPVLLWKGSRQEEAEPNATIIYDGEKYAIPYTLWGLMRGWLIMGSRINESLVSSSNLLAMMERIEIKMAGDAAPLTDKQIAFYKKHGIETKPILPEVEDFSANRPIEHLFSANALQKTASGYEPAGPCDGYSVALGDSYPLWQLLHEEHGLILLNGEIEDIINVATTIIEQRKNSDVRRIALERDRMRHALQKIEAESHDARAVDYAEAALR